LVCILTIISLKQNDIGLPVDIILLTGDTNESRIDATYYEISNYAILYIDSFKSKKTNQGYGSLLLGELNNIVKDINDILQYYKLKTIKSIEGIVVAEKNIISEELLKNLYIKYGFKIDCKNNMIKYL
ncbi:MAG: hypothetical protein RSE41_09935, partial [Clostridia bacterium]